MKHLPSIYSRKNVDLFERMKIQKLHIQNYKSLVDLQIVEPNLFTVFAGSNASGKSNIFEALEFFQFNINNDPYVSHKSFGGIENILSRTPKNSFLRYSYGKEDRFHEFEKLGFSVKYDEYESDLNILVRLKDFTIDIVTSYMFNSKSAINDINDKLKRNQFESNYMERMKKVVAASNTSLYKQLFYNFTRVFVTNSKINVRITNSSDINLSSDSSNLEKVLGRILKDRNKQEEIISWLDLLVPGFDNIEIVSEPLSGTDSLVIYEKGTNKPFTKSLLSDGTWNILALLTAVYQSDEPQFLCIEEPENGLNPKVQKELINLFRQKCEEEGHYIWLNTHSQTIVNQLEPKELILVDKIDGETRIKQLGEFDTSGLPMDEAWLTNTLGGGIPW